MHGRLVRFFIEPTAPVRPRDYRTFVLLNVGVVAAIALHAAVTIVFQAIGAWPMVVANLASALAYGVALRCNRRGHHVATVVIALVELMAHQTLAVYFLGWEPGFQYYLISITAVAFYLPAGRTIVKLGVLVAAAGTYVGLYVWSRNALPVLELAPTVAHVLGTANVVAVFALMSVFAHNYTRAAELAEIKLAAEHARAEALLRNILPDSIAERLKADPHVIADGFPEATVLFADIVGFTPLAEATPPEQLVSMLNEVFSEFDDLVSARGLEKIKTIGDAYMVAAGIPERRADHVAAVAELALDMRASVRSARTWSGRPLQVRIGVHTGPVVAGVIGKRKFVYDLWGDSVNTAARMESHGLPGEIQVSEDVAAALGEGYVLEDRGIIEVKGKGPMRTWLLKGRRPAA